MGFSSLYRLFQRKRAPVNRNRGRQVTRERRVNRRIKPKAGTTVLIVDDSRTVRRLMSNMLQQSGYRPLEAENGMQGIEMARSHKPSLIFMDVMMPGMDGFQATRKLQTDVDTQDIPVIIVSGNKQATIQTWVRKIGARGFMAKPFDRGEFFRRLENALYPLPTRVTPRS